MRIETVPLPGSLLALLVPDRELILVQSGASSDDVALAIGAMLPDVEPAEVDAWLTGLVPDPA